jgi:hypothetical protein
MFYGWQWANSKMIDNPSVISRQIEVVNKRRTFLWICLILALALPGKLSSQNLEYKVKAEFLERFTRFIEWPIDANRGNGSPFRICVVGKNPFDSYLAQMAATVKIKGRVVQVVESVDLAQIQNCQILFIASSEKSRLKNILNITRDKPILTVGDTTGFAQDGVLINFYSTGSYIRFEVNLQGVEQSRLKFSSRLLKLAKLV